MKAFKKEQGIALISLIITIIVMSVLLVSMTVNFSQTTKLRNFNAVKEDILTLSEAIKEYYVENGDITDICGNQVNNFNPGETYINPNDASNQYYIINIAQLQNAQNIRIRKQDNTYIVNKQSLTVYLQNGTTYEGQTYYTILDDFSGEVSVQDYYKSVSLPIIPVVKLESNGIDKTKATMGDTVTLKMLKNYDFVTSPTISINGNTVTPTWSGSIGTATYTLTLEDMVNLEGQAIPISISGYTTSNMNGPTISNVTVGSGVSVYAKLFTTADIKNNASIDSENGSFYGAYVTNYITDNDIYIKDNAQGQNWKILYAGKLNEDDTGSHIYLIASNYIHYNGMPTVMVNGVEKTAQVTYNDGADIYPYRGNFKNIRSAYSGSEAVAESMRYLNKNYYEFLATQNSTNSISTRENMKSVAYMLDINIWNKYAKTHADWAIGGPSIELLIESMNDKHYSATKQLLAGSIEATSQAEIVTISVYGYRLSTNNGNSWGTDMSASLLSTALKTDTLYFMGNSTDITTAYCCFTSSPSDYTNENLKTSLVGNWGAGTVGEVWYDYGRAGFRPVVRLNSNVKFKAVNVGTNQSFQLGFAIAE